MLSLLNHDAQALTVSITPHKPLVDQNGLSSNPDVAGSHAVASPTPLEKAGAKSSFHGLCAEGSPATLAMVGCLPMTSTEAECLFSEGSRIGEPLFSLGKAESKGDKASKDLVLSKFVLNPPRIGSKELGSQGGDEGGRVVCARDIHQSMLALTEVETVCADVGLGDVVSLSPPDNY